MNTSTNETLKWLCISTALACPMYGHAQADSVSAGKFRGNWKGVFLKEDRSAKAQYLLQGASLGTSARDPSGAYAYGVFTNRSPYAVTLVLNHQGGNKERHHYIWVDEIMVAKSVNIDTSAPVLVPPRSSYRWEVKDSYRISAWILSNEEGLDLDAISRLANLPTKQNFENPTRQIGRYLGCVVFYTDRYIYNGDQLVLSQSSLDKTLAYNEALEMSDRSSSGQDSEYFAEFGTYAAPGIAIQNKGACFERRTRDLPTSDNGGGAN
jgi:hypothetical protein